VANADDLVTVAESADRDRANGGIKPRDVAATGQNADSAFSHSGGNNSRIRVVQKTPERAMKIDFRYDVAQAFKDAKQQRKPLLLDFSAAPM